MLSTLQAHPDLILSIPKYEHRLHEQIEQFKAVAELIDGSRLHINEVWVANKLEKYAYYRISPANQVIHG